MSVSFGVSAVRRAFAQTDQEYGPIVRRSTDVSLAAQTDPVFSFRIQTFKPYVGDYFQAQDARSGTIALKLMSLDAFKTTKTALRLTSSSEDTDSFRLTFKADARLPLFVSIHKLSHPALGQFELFLTERKSDNGDFYYEAVINHIQ